MFLFVGSAHAGIWDKFKDVAIDKVAGAVISGVFFLLSLFLGARVFKWKKIATEGKDVTVAIYTSTREDSPGGPSITGIEVDRIIAEAGEFGVAVVEAVGLRERKR